MQQNLINGDSINSSDTAFLQPAPRGKECCARSPLSPEYLCTRPKGHSGDHAAHGIGWRSGVPQFARWPKSFHDLLREARRYEARRQAERFVAGSCCQVTEVSSWTPIRFSQTSARS